jgi:anti-sigma-K factor RskA
MTSAEDAETAFERHARGVLEESVRRIDGRTRSRLNQARHAALAAAQGRRPAWWRSFTMVPAAGAAAAALLVAVMLWQRQPAAPLLPVVAGQHAPVAAEDMDLLADSDGLDLMEGWDGQFYEWAADQTEGNAESNG